MGIKDTFKDVRAKPPLHMAYEHCKPARDVLHKLARDGKATCREVLEDKAGVVVERWLVGKHVGILMATPLWWDFFAPIIPVDAENATLSAIENMAEME